MTIWAGILAAVGLLLTGGAVMGSVAGWGLSEPTQQPISVREGSVRHGAVGTTFFVAGGRSMRGGGIHSGK